MAPSECDRRRRLPSLALTSANGYRVSLSSDFPPSRTPSSPLPSPLHHPLKLRVFKIRASPPPCVPLLTCPLKLRVFQILRSSSPVRCTSSERQPL